MKNLEDMPTLPNESQLANLCRHLVESAAAFADFVSDPLAAFRARRIVFSADFERRAVGKSLSEFLASGGDPLSRLAPGELDIPNTMAWQQSQEPPWIVPVAIVAVAIASTPAVFSAEIGSCDNATADPNLIPGGDHDK